MKITEESLKQQTDGTPDTPSAQVAPPSAEPPKSEKEKIKSMTGRDRAWYIWAYYKFHIIAAIVVVVVACNVGSALYRGTYDTALYCIYLNSRGETEVNPAPLETDFAGFLDLSKKELITTEISYISYGDDATEYSYASMAKISALVASHELDIVIGDQESIDHYASLNALLNVETALSPDVQALTKDRLYRAEGEDKTAYSCAIDLSGTDFASESNLAQTPPLLGIIANSKRTDTVETLIRYIFEP